MGLSPTWNGVSLKCTNAVSSRGTPEVRLWDGLSWRSHSESPAHCSASPPSPPARAGPRWPLSGPCSYCQVRSALLSAWRRRSGKEETVTPTEAYGW